MASKDGRIRAFGPIVASEDYALLQFLLLCVLCFTMYCYVLLCTTTNYYAPPRDTSFSLETINFQESLHDQVRVK